MSSESSEPDAPTLVAEEMPLRPASARRIGEVALSHIALLAAAAIYSGWNIVFSRCLSGGVSPIGFSVVREACAFPLMDAWAAVREAPLRMPLPAHRVRFVLLGLVLAGFQLCFAVGVALTDAQTAALFQCLEPSTAAFLGALLRLEKLTAGRVLSALLAAAGILLMQLTGEHASGGPVRSASERAVGSVFLFGQGVGIAGYCLLQKGLMRTGGHSASAGNAKPFYGPVTLTAHAYAGSLLAMLLAAGIDSALRLEAVPPLSSHSLSQLVAPRALIAVAYAVVLSSAVGYSLRAWANRTLDASTLVLYNAVQPPMTALLALVFEPGSRYGWPEAGGTAMVMLAVWVSAKGDAALARMRVRDMRRRERER